MTPRRGRGPRGSVCHACVALRRSRPGEPRSVRALDRGIDSGKNTPKRAAGFARPEAIDALTKDEIQQIIGRLRFGDPEQIRLKQLLDEHDAATTSGRVDAWLDDSLRRVGGCPPETLAGWARGLDQAARREARRKVEGLRAVVLAMDMFLEEAGREPEPSPDKP